MKFIDGKIFSLKSIIEKINNKTLLIILSFFIITIFLSWPLILNLDGFLLSQDYKDINHSDTILHIDHMLQSRDLFFKGKDFIIVPEKGCFAQSYSLAGILFTGLLKIDEILYHNLFFLISIFLSGLFMYFLMLEFSKDRITSFFAGFIYMSSNYIFHQYIWGHANIWQIQWIPLIFLFLEKTIKYEKIKYSIILGVSLSLMVISSAQYVAYLSFIIPIYILLRNYFNDKKILMNKIFWLNMFISLVIAFFLSSFYIFKRMSTPTVIRTIGENMGEYWVLTSFKQLIDFNTNISIGFIQFLLVLFGIYVIWINIKDKDYKKYFPFVILFIFLIICMAGPFDFYAPYFWLYKLWPFVNRFRVPRRLFPFVLMCTSILSSLFLVYLKKLKKSEKYRLIILVITIIAIIVFQILNSVWLSNHHIFYP